MNMVLNTHLNRLNATVQRHRRSSASMPFWASGHDVDCPSKGLLGENIVWMDLSHSTKDSILCISPCCKPLWKASLHRCQEPSPPWEEIRIRDKIPGKTNLKFPHAFTCLLQWKMLWASSCQRARTYILWKILHSFDPQDLSINWLHVSHLIIRI